MSLNNNSIKNLNNQFKSYDSLFDLACDLIKFAKWETKSVLRVILIFSFSITLSTYLMINSSFSPIFEYMTNISITFSAGLLCLLIAGLTIILSSLSKNSLYCLILQPEKKNISFYKKTLFQCIEPLIWFLILLMLSYILKLLYFFYKTVIIINLLIPIIKIIVISLLLIVTLISLFSLETFILNMYNLLAANAQFEILERHAKSNNLEFDELLKNFENQFNDATNN